MNQQQTTRLIMIRHGQSQANAERRVQGWADAPLTHLGQHQAQRVADRLHAEQVEADMLFASPLQRAHQTAAAVGSALGLEVQLREALREVYLGWLEDTSDKVFNAALASEDFHSYGVESDTAFTERALGALYGLLAAYHSKTIIVVTHLGVICTALAYWFDRDVSAAWETYGNIPNTGITEVLVRDEQITLVRHGDTPHLEA